MAVAMLVVTGDSSEDVDSGFTNETLHRVSFTEMIVMKRKNYRSSFNAKTIEVQVTGWKPVQFNLKSWEEVWIPVESTLMKKCH